mmetsp:Transcript_56563/g.137340  ORF Transcript_56563/g.137340 Transcript_56563/m.137340 type:complete len:397 (-) Transcript_56563:1440-2630(-)
MEPSLFWTHLERAGIVSFFAATGFLGAAFFGDGAVFCALAFPKIDNVGRLFGAGLATGLGSAFGFGFDEKSDKVGRLGVAAFLLEGVGVAADFAGVFGLDPPNNENDGAGAFLAGAGEGAGAAAFGAAGLLPNKESTGLGAGTGVGAGAGAFFGAGLLKSENEGAGAAFEAGAGEGAGVFFGEGLLNNEKDGAGAFFEAGAGAGAFLAAGSGAEAFFAGAFLEPPKNELKASDTGSLVSILGAGGDGVAGFAATGFFLGDGLLSKSFPRLNVGLDAAGLVAGLAAGLAVIFATGFGAGGAEGFGAAFFGAAGLLALLSKIDARFNVGRGADFLAAGLAGDGVTFGGDLGTAGGAFLDGSGLPKKDAILTLGLSALACAGFAVLGGGVAGVGSCFFD